VTGSAPGVIEIFMARRYIRRWLPSNEAVQRNRMLRWLGPSLRHPRLWILNRRAIALGLAIGVFFGFLIPVAQILFAAIIAIVLRANIPAAALATLVTNPFTFAPIYLLAYRVGAALLGAPVDVAPSDAGAAATTDVLAWVGDVGKPLILGLSLFAVTGAVVTYFGALALWRFAVGAQWRRRRRRRLAV
jgi:uncharacterized protein (DUF2062 family)